jgi:hypothetical protein
MGEKCLQRYFFIIRFGDGREHGDDDGTVFANGPFYDCEGRNRAADFCHSIFRFSLKSAPAGALFHHAARAG